MSTSIPANVPGDVHTALMKAGILEDPYYRYNDVKYSWVGYSDWIYSTTFTGRILHCKGTLRILS
ncbi:hypothetical protein ACF0H5_012016 [Mactra antiquata]